MGCVGWFSCERVWFAQAAMSAMVSRSVPSRSKMMVVIFCMVVF